MSHRRGRFQTEGSARGTKSRGNKLRTYFACSAGSVRRALPFFFKTKPFLSHKGGPAKPQLSSIHHYIFFFRLGVCGIELLISTAVYQKQADRTSRHRAATRNDLPSLHLLRYIKSPPPTHAAAKIRPPNANVPIPQQTIPFRPPPSFFQTLSPPITPLPTNPPPPHPRILLHRALVHFTSIQKPHPDAQDRACYRALLLPLRQLSIASVILVALVVHRSFPTPAPAPFDLTGVG